jgi:hypothetical protein
VARSESKAPNDAPVDGNPDLLNFVAAVSWIGCQMSFLPQKYWPNPGKLDGLISRPLIPALPSLYLAMSVEGNFWMRSWLVSLILFPSANF